MTFVKTNTRSGFTLIELMIAMAILGLLMAVAGPYAYNMYQKAKKDRAVRDLKGIKQGIGLFEMDLGRLPNNLRELIKEPSDASERIKWMDGGYLGAKKKLPKDPWGSSYVYKKEPYKDNPYTLFSKGSGGRRGKPKERIHVWDLD